MSGARAGAAPATPALAAPVTSAPAAPEPGYLRLLVRHLWAAFPALLVSSCAVCAGGIAVAILQPGLTPLALVAWAVIVGPLFGGLVAQAADVVLGVDVRTLSYIRYLRRAAVPGGLAALIPAATGAVFVVALSWWGATSSPIALIALCASGPVCGLSLLAGVVVLPVSLRMPALRGWPLVLFSLGAAARRPTTAIGALAVVVIVVVGALQLSASLLLLLPAPLALIVVVASWTAAARMPGWPDGAAVTAADGGDRVDGDRLPD